MPNVWRGLQTCCKSIHYTVSHAVSIYIYIYVYIHIHTLRISKALAKMYPNLSEFVQYVQYRFAEIQTWDSRRWSSSRGVSFMPRRWTVEDVQTQGGLFICGKHDMLGFTWICVIALQPKSQTEPTWSDNKWEKDLSLLNSFKECNGKLAN